MKSVSVIVPTRNSAATLERCLRSIEAQDYPEVEIVVVDNGSIDETVQIAGRFATVISGGSERSEQVNIGAAHARGAYLYRVDGDFELEPGVIRACVEAVEERGVDVVAIPNRSAGDSFWAQVRRMERDTYRGDDLIVAARFWRREAFEAVGGFDETLVACEDYDLHNRLLAAGKRLGRTELGEIHVGEAATLWAHAAQSFYYGPSVLRYLRKHPSRGTRQMFPLRPSYLRHWGDLVRRPHLLLGLLVLKSVQYAAAGLAIILASLGLVDDRAHTAPSAIAACVLVVAALGALASMLPRFGFPVGRSASAGIILGGAAVWVLTGRRRARKRNQPLSAVVPLVALAYTPFLLGLALGEWLSGDSWLIAFSLTVSIAATTLTALAEPGGGTWRRAPWVVVAAVAAFVLLFSLHAISQLATRSMDAYDVAVYDQALWATANDLSRGRLLTSSINGESLLAQTPAPVLLLCVPLYTLGIGGPMLLLGSHILAVGLVAVAIYRLGARRLGSAGATLIALAYLAYFTTLRAAEHGFRVETIGAAAILFALDSLESDRPLLAYLLLAVALMCGVESSLTVAALGGVLLLTRSDQWHGSIILILGCCAAWVLAVLVVPYFGGTAGGPLAVFGAPAGSSWTNLVADAVWRPDALRYLGLLLLPLAGLPLLGAGWLLPAVAGLLLNLMRNHLGAAGPSEALISPFLLLAAIHGIDWTAGRAREHRRKAVPIIFGVLVLSTCVLTTRFLNAGLLDNLIRWPSQAERGAAVLEEIPARASLASQDRLAPLLAHRSELYLLPEVQDAAYVLFDRFDTDLGPWSDLVDEAFGRAVSSPVYGLKAAQEGILLFERGLDPAGKSDMVLAGPEEVDFPTNQSISGIVAFRGYSVSATSGDLDEPFVLATFWESLAPVRRPYLILIAGPGFQLFQEAGCGLRPVTVWREGDLVKHEVLVSLPALPDGEEYEIVGGLWYDEGEPALRYPEQLLGEDVTRIASLWVTDEQYELRPWGSTGNE